MLTEAERAAAAANAASPILPPSPNAQAQALQSAEEQAAANAEFHARAAYAQAELAHAQALQVQAVGLKLAPFFTQNPQFWFDASEAQFGIRNITSDDTKFWYTISALDHSTYEAVASIVRRVRNGTLRDNKFQRVKEVLLEKYGVRPVRQFYNLLKSAGETDRSVTELFNKVGAMSVTLEEMRMATTLFILPQGIQHELGKQKFKTFEEMYEMAKLIEEQSSSTSIAAVRSKPKTNRKPQTSAEDVCYYHKRFGKEAKKCRKPCKMCHLVNMADVEEEESVNFPEYH